jgi:hypothetical protein
MRNPVPAINRALGVFCFSHGTPLIQFGVIEATSASQTDQLGQVTLNAPRYGADGWEDWYSRCLTPVNESVGDNVTPSEGEHE